MKNDYLKVSVWEIIAKVFSKIGKPIMSLKELLVNLDDKVWDIFKNGLTCTVNQTDSDWGTHLVKEYRPQSVEDLSKFVAAIRPSFDSWRDSFIAREKYSTGVYELDEVLTSTDHYILFQENLMQYFIWLGISPADSIGLIKKISKKKIGQDDFDKLTTGLKENWIKNTGGDYLFDETWEMVQSCIAYGFCSAHAYAVAIDACYGAYLKSHYPMEYYEVVLSMYGDDAYRTKKLIDELKYFNIELKGIKFGESLSEYKANKDENSIYKGIASIKYCNDRIANEMFELAKDTKFDHFIDVIHSIKTQTSTDYRQLKILTILGFFDAFGKNKKLYQMIKLYEELYSRKQISIKDLSKFEKKLNIEMDVIYKYCGRQTEKTLMDLDMNGFIKEASNSIEDKPFSIKEQCKYELEYLEYVTYINENVSDTYYIVTDFKVYKDKTKPYLQLYQINSGNTIKTKVTAGVKFSHNPFEKFSILKIINLVDRLKAEFINGQWIKTSKTEVILDNWDVIS